MVKKVTKYKIIELFTNNYNKRIYLREIACLLGKPHQTIKPYVELLVNENILKKEKRKNIVDYSLNFKNPSMLDYLIIAEKEKLQEKLQKEIYIKILFEKLSIFFRKNIYILFGSGINKIKKDSDIDLLIIGNKNCSIIIKDFEQIYNKKLHVIQITKISKLNLSLTKEIYKKHIIFNNTEKIINYFDELNEKNKLV